MADPDTAPVSLKLRALLDIAALVAQSGLAVTDQVVDAGLKTPGVATPLLACDA